MNYGTLASYIRSVWKGDGRGEREMWKERREKMEKDSQTEDSSCIRGI